MSPLQVTASPHLGGPDTTQRIMWSVVWSLVPVVVVAAWTYGPSALLMVGVSTLAAVATERAFGKPRSLGDGSAVITGILIGLCLPAGLPLWMAALGSAAGIGLGKLIFGGLGQNVFNPALLGRAFLQAAFPVAMTTWPALGGDRPWWHLHGDNFAWPLMAAGPDIVTGATPLGLMKFEQTITPVGDLLFARASGSVGEAGAIVILLGGAWLVLRNCLNWRIPAGIFLTVAIFAGLLHWMDAARYPSVPFALFSGGLVLGAVYMATDPVTAPITNLGRWVFAAGIGILVVVIRMWGGLPEGVMFAILIMNALVPFINRATEPRVFGTRLKGTGR
jgi:Na+-translocating ferredoxin:NAD+ oxidoreductase subunit D